MESGVRDYLMQLQSGSINIDQAERGIEQVIDRRIRSEMREIKHNNHTRMMVATSLLMGIHSKDNTMAFNPEHKVDIALKTADYLLEKVGGF